jgi:hypothetical protein
MRWSCAFTHSSFGSALGYSALEERRGTPTHPSSQDGHGLQHHTVMPCNSISISTTIITISISDQ